MNILNLQPLEQELEKAFTALQLSESNVVLARDYLFAADAQDSLLDRAEAQDFCALHSSRFAVAGKLMRALSKAPEEVCGRMLKLMWAIGGISVCQIWGNIGISKICDGDTLAWRCQVLGVPRAVYMAVQGLGGQLRGEEWADALFALAEREPMALVEAQKLCGNSDPNTLLLLGAIVMRVCADRDVVNQQTALEGTLLIGGLKSILPGIPRDQLMELADYIAKGDPAAPVPTPGFIHNPATNAMSAQYASSGVDDLLGQFSVAAFLAAKENHVRCALRIYLMLNTRRVFYSMYASLPKKLFAEAVDLLRQDAPGGGAALLLILAQNTYHFGYERSQGWDLILDRCRENLPEAMRLAGPGQYLTLLSLGGADLPNMDLREKLTTFFSKISLRGQDQVQAFLENGSLADIHTDLNQAVGGGYANPSAGVALLRNYLDTYGWDEFACRCCAVVGFVCKGDYLHTIAFKDQGEYDGEILCEMARQLIRRGLTAFDMMTFFDGDHDTTYNQRAQVLLRDAVLALAKTEYTDDFCRAVGAGTVFLRSTALDGLCALSAEPGAKEAILSAAGDSSKQIREQVARILPRHPEWTEDYKALLTAKKAAVRQLAAEVLGRLGQREALEAALAKEKNAKVADAIRAVLGAEAAAPVGSAADLAVELTRGNKRKKLSWLLDDQLQKVRNADGTPADDAIRNAILLSYCELGRIGRSDTAAELSAGLDADDMAKLAVQVYDRWFASGAQAKQKWVLPFAAVYGGTAMTQRLTKAIHDWPEHQRGAIACDAVMALALSSDPAAIVIVDSLSRKFKFRQIKVAAAAALENAAQELGITAEELADRIVPDLGFSRDGKRTFAYGKRSFTVRLTSTLELEITNNEGKTVKSMPAPGKTDDPQAADAYEAFKTMKKGIKTTVAAQRSRLEAALSVLRCWDTQRWQALFVDNPIMHQFAMSLIWGVYEDGKLTDTFRYMEDGTFNTVDEDEYTLPENAKIGLVHPVELDDDTLDGWKQQLEDYEIKQSIDQLNRTVHILDESKAGEKALEDFGGKLLNALSLSGKLLQQGWYRGSVQDGGAFYCFYREDKELGIGAELRFSGTAVGYDDGENVTVYDAVFYTGTVSRGSYVYDTLSGEQIVPLGEVPTRYYSEIVHQLTRATASSTETNKNWKSERQD